MAHARSDDETEKARRAALLRQARLDHLARTAAADRAQGSPAALARWRALADALRRTPREPEA